MVQTLYFIYFVSDLMLLFAGAQQYRRTRHLGTLLSLLVLTALAYDNLILFLGNFVGAGSTLHALSVPRFLLHNLLTPLLVVVAVWQARLAGLAFALRPNALRWAWGAALSLSVLGILTKFVGLQLQPETLDGLLRYTAIAPKGPPLGTLLSVLFAGIIGGFIWRKTGWFWLALTVIGVFAVEIIIGVRGARLLAGSGFEVLLMWAFLAGDNRFAG
ncbi:MAG: hypothetical protein OHK0052_04260 [Anaerolineales bacterium]